VYILATDSGGMLHYLAQLANAVSKHANVVVIGPKEFPYNYFSSHIKIIDILDCPVRLRMYKALSFMNINIINNVCPDIIHVTMSQPFIALFLFLMRVYKKYPMIYTNHDPKPHIDLKPEEIFGHLLHNHLLKYDRIIVHGEILRNILIKSGVLDKRIEVIPMGSFSFFRNLTPKNSISEERNTILFFGSIRKYKGLEYLIKATPFISKELPDLKVIIAGFGDLSRFSELLTDKTRFEIHNRLIPDEMVAKLFYRAQLLILPYIEASQSGPLHIAYAFKKPVVATNVGSIPEIVEHGKTGLLVPPKDEKALAEAIITLLKDDKLREEMGENAYKKSIEELSWDKIANKLIEVYKEVINERMH